MNILPTPQPTISVSIVSHLQASLLERLLADLDKQHTEYGLELVLTLNLPETLPFDPSAFSFPVTVRTNASPKGFSANHNQAFDESSGQFFCVMNPDIRMPENPFPVLLEEIGRLRGAVIAPAILSPAGRIEDSIRRFPTPLSLVGKLLGRSDGRYPFALGDGTFAADWVGGMFMLFRAEDFRRVGGFDEGFFLYYEDVDLCARLWKAGRRVLACPRAQVIHDARRASRRNLRYLRWHIASLARYLAKHWLRLPNTQGR